MLIINSLDDRMIWKIWMGSFEILTKGSGVLYKVERCQMIDGLKLNWGQPGSVIFWSLVATKHTLFKTCHYHGQIIWFYHTDFSKRNTAIQTITWTAASYSNYSIFLRPQSGLLKYFTKWKLLLISKHTGTECMSKPSIH